MDEPLSAVSFVDLKDSKQDILLILHLWTYLILAGDVLKKLVFKKLTNDVEV